MSVTLAPRALIEEKAAWPGVSRKVIFSPEGSWTGEETQSSLELKKLLHWLFSSIGHRNVDSDPITEAPPPSVTSGHMGTEWLDLYQEHPASFEHTQKGANVLCDATSLCGDNLALP